MPWCLQVLTVFTVSSSKMICRHCLRNCSQPKIPLGLLSSSVFLSSTPQTLTYLPQKYLLSHFFIMLWSMFGRGCLTWYHFFELKRKKQPKAYMMAAVAVY